MTPFLRKLLGQNWLLLLTMLGLAIFGVVAIYSATSTRTDAYAADFWRKQANWVAVGVFAFMVTSLIHYRWIRWGALPMYLAGIVFLILTKFIGTKVYGARSWLHLGPLNFQPAQLAVVAGIMVLAIFLTQFREMHPMLRLLLSGAIAAAPCLLILMQPDLGEVIIWIPVLLALWFVGGGIQSAKHADRAWLSPCYCCAQRLHFRRHWRAMGICRWNPSPRRVPLAPDDMSFCCFSCR